jgi:glycogen operon protein
LEIAARPGSPRPLGAHSDARGTNFALLAPDARELALVLYADERGEPAAVLALDPARHRTGDYWHVYVEGVGPGAWYAWRTSGRELLDPCARAVSTALWDRATAIAGAGAGMRARVVAEDDYDWEGDAPLGLPTERAIVYELHVAGFTRHPSSGVQRPGTFAGLIEKIPYLQSLGVTHVELMPVMAFDAQDVPAGTAALGLRNYWGYSPVAFFAVHAAYADGDARRELRDLVKALHRAGLGVILDVVLNHTAEGGAGGPTLHFKALANRSFYHVYTGGTYANFSGTGNTINCNHPTTSLLLLECLEYWVREMHVDGFRLDMASVLTRGEDGVPRADAWLPGAIAHSPVLARTWLIAEPWDAGGAYQVGTFPRGRYAEWNGRFRDTVRRFVRGDGGLLGELASRIAGSEDLYRASGRTPAHSINFVTCHDGFTLWDLVSYDRKHNEANGEDNRDGNDANWSSNCGIEGETANARVLRLRARQVRNLLAVLMLSRGVPMLLGGDEVLRTQHGNNNAWCQDNELSWLDWGLVEKHADMLRYTRELIALRKRHPALARTERAPAGDPDIRWHGPDGREPRWRDPDGHVLAYTFVARAPDEPLLHVVLNMSEAAVHVPLPAVEGRRWHVALDTWQAPPRDILPPAEQVPYEDPTVLVHAFSVVALEASAADEKKPA